MVYFYAAPVVDFYSAVDTIGAGTARAFLDAQSVPYETAPSAKRLESADVAAKARRFTVPLECWK